MTPESPVASRFVAGLGFRTKVLKTRPMLPLAVVVHTTGGGILSRFAREGARKGDASPFDTAVRVYTTIMPQSGHYVVGQLGQCAQVVPEMTIAQHVGSAKSRAYWLPRERWMTPELTWWRDRWPELDSPIDLADGQLWADGSCNRNAVGIEVVPPESGARDAWSPECWRTLAALVLDITARHHIPCDREHVLTHSDAHPISRSAKGAPWDVGPLAWSWDRMREAIAAGG